MPTMGPLLLCRFALTTAAVLLGGTAALRLLSIGLPGVYPVVGRRRLSWSCATIIFLAGVLQLVLTAAEMCDCPLAQACTFPMLWNVVSHSRFGLVWEIRTGILAAWFLVALGGVWRPTAASRRSLFADTVAAALVAGLLGSLVFAGHAHASPKHAWLLPGDVVHAVAAGAWPGGLLPLALLLHRARHDPARAVEAVVLARRFSRMSLVAVTALAFSGTLNAVGLVGTWPALWRSDYGRLILAKIILFALMVAVGSRNRRMLAVNRPGDAAGILTRLWRNVGVECGLALGLLLATEALAMHAPPAP